MEEKNFNEAQVAEQTTSQENKNEQMSMTEYFDTLKAENEQLQKELASSREWASRNYVQAQIMRKTIDALKAKYNITDGEMYGIMMDANDITMDDLLVRLSR